MTELKNCFLRQMLLKLLKQLFRAEKALFWGLNGVSFESNAQLIRTICYYEMIAQFCSVLFCAVLFLFLSHVFYAFQ